MSGNVEKKKQISVDKGRVFGALLTGQSKAFGVLDHVFFIVLCTIYFILRKKNTDELRNSLEYSFSTV